LEAETDTGSSGDIDKLRRRQNLIRRFARGRNRTPLNRAHCVTNERMTGIECRRAARLCVGLITPIHAEQEYRIGRMYFGVRLRPHCVRLYGAPERGVCVVYPPETDIRVRQRRERRHIVRIELHCARQRLRRRAKPLRILMQTPEQRPRLGIGRIDGHGAIELCCGIACLAGGYQHACEQLSRREVVGPFRQQTFERRTRLYVIASLREFQRAAFDRIRIRHLRQRHTERDGRGQQRRRESFHRGRPGSGAFGVHSGSIRGGVMIVPWWANACSSPRCLR
jgi:hypothetical protein